MKILNNLFQNILFCSFITLLFISCGKSTQVASTPADLVYTQLDSENSRWFYFSSACRPFGMVNLSPDTEIDGAWGSGYSLAMFMPGSYLVCQ